MVGNPPFPGAVAEQGTVVAAAAVTGLGNGPGEQRDRLKQRIPRLAVAPEAASATFRSARLRRRDMTGSAVTGSLSWHMSHARLTLTTRSYPPIILTTPEFKHTWCTVCGVRDRPGSSGAFGLV
jgi:hypothetical protein